MVILLIQKKSSPIPNPSLASVPLLTAITSYNGKYEGYEKRKKNDFLCECRERKI